MPHPPRFRPIGLPYPPFSAGKPMAVLRKRVEYEVKHRARKTTRLKKLELGRAERDYKRRQNERRVIMLKVKADARRLRKEEYALGPLTPMRNFLGEEEGLLHQSLFRQEELPKHMQTPPWVVPGDRVVLLEGPDKGCIGQVKTVNVGRRAVTVKGHNMAEREVPDWAQELQRSPRSPKIIPTEVEVPWGKVRLVATIKDPKDGRRRDVVVMRLNRRELGRHPILKEETSFRASDKKKVIYERWPFGMDDKIYMSEFLEYDDVDEHAVDTVWKETGSKTINARRKATLEARLKRSLRMQRIPFCKRLPKNTDAVLQNILIPMAERGELTPQYRGILKRLQSVPKRFPDEHPHVIVHICNHIYRHVWAIPYPQEEDKSSLWARQLDDSLHDFKDEKSSLERIKGAQRKENEAAEKEEDEKKKMHMTAAQKKQYDLEKKEKRKAEEKAERQKLNKRHSFSNPNYVTHESFKPTLITPPQPPSVIDEVRNKYSKTKTRWDMEVERDAYHHQQTLLANRKTAAMRTPMEELRALQNQRKRVLQAALPKPDRNNLPLPELPPPPPPRSVSVLCFSPDRAALVKKQWVRGQEPVRKGLSKKQHHVVRRQWRIAAQNRDLLEKSRFVKGLAALLARTQTGGGAQPESKAKSKSAVV